MKKKLDALKERPKEERTAIAGGFALLIAAILLIGWGFFFFQRLANGSIEEEWGPRTNQIDFSELRSITESFSESYSDSTEELRRLREEAAREQLRREGQSQVSTEAEIQGTFYPVDSGQ
jgi:hypothetical protein